MKIDVAKQIVEIILDLGEVRIPGLGNFRIEHKPAKLSSGKTLIGPPEIDVVFDEESGESIELLNRVKKNFKLRKNEAEKVVDAFSQKVLNNLVNFDRVRITGLGMLGKGENNIVDFTPNKGFVKQYYKGLPEVPTQITGTTKKLSSTVKAETEEPTVVKKKKEKTIVKKAEEKTKSTSKSKSTPKSTKSQKPKKKSSKTKEKIEETQEEATKAIPPVVIPPIEDKVESTKIEKKSEDKELVEKPIQENVSNEKVSSVDETEKTTPSTYLETSTASDESISSSEKEESIIASTSSSIIDSKVEEPKVVTEPYHPPFEEEKSSLLWPILILCLLVLAGLFGMKKCSSTGDNQTPELVRNETLDSVLTHFDPEQENAQDSIYDDAQDLKEEMTVETGTDEMVNEDETLTANPDKCIIITGVFKSDRNAKRMMKELKTGGYIPYAENYGEYLRVGFEFDCQDTELEDFIRAVRMNISKDAWYLQPAIEVF